MEESLAFIERQWRYVKYVLLIHIVIAFTVFCLVLYLVGLEGISQLWLVNITIDGMGIAICCFIYFSALKMTVKSNQEDISFMILTWVSSLLISADAITWMVSGHSGMYFLHEACYVMQFFGSIIAVSVYYMYCINALNLEWKEYGLYSTASAVVGIFSEFLVLLNIKYHYYYMIDASGIYQRGKLYQFSLVGPFFIGFMLLIIIVIADRSWKDKRKLLLYMVVPFFVGIVQNMKYGIPALMLGLLLSLVLIYTNIFKKRSLDVATQNKELLEKQNEILKYKSQAMISQIQPHFMYNMLGTIQMLCEDDPRMASQVINRFAKYFRGNVDSIKIEGLVSFSRELEHIRNYLYLEHIRFEDVFMRIRPIESQDFMVPVLSIQPIVENAMRNGIMSREEGGVIAVTETEEDRYHVIRVFDNREYNDLNEFVEVSEIQNELEHAIHRLKVEVQADIQIEYTDGVGLTVTIKVPVHEKP